MESSITSNCNNGIKLLDAAMEGRADDAVELLRIDPSLIHIADPIGDTAVHVAARAGNGLTVSKMINYLVCDHLRIHKDDPKMVKDVLCKRNAHGDTPLHLALKNDHKDAVVRLVLADRLVRLAIFLMNDDQESALDLANRAGIDLKNLSSEHVHPCGNDDDVLPLFAEQWDTSPPHPMVGIGRADVLMRNELTYLQSNGDDDEEERTDNSPTALHAAARNGNIGPLKKMVEFIENKSESSERWPVDDGIDSFIHIGAKEYKLLVEGNLNGLLELKVDFNKLRCKEEENSVLHIAASAGQAQLIYELLPLTKGIIKWRNNKGDLAFHSAVKASQLGSLKALLDWGKYDPNEKIDRNLLGAENDEGETPLHIAVENNQDEMARILVEQYGQACYHLNERLSSPLYLAIRSKYWGVVKLMITCTKEQKSDSEPKLLQGKSVVHAAIAANNEEILRELLDNHMNLIESVHGNNNESPLSYAAFKGFLKGVQHLLQNFPDYAYKCDKIGSFPIHRAASGGNIKVVKELHMTKNLLNQKGQSILHVAAASGSSEVVSYLLKLSELDRLINLKDEDGNTPLHLASKGFHPRVVYILTRDGRCKLELLNKKGLTAIDYVELDAGSFPSFEARLTWLALRCVNAPQSSISARKSYAKIDKVSDEKELDKSYAKIDKVSDEKELEHFMKRADTLMLVATLIATVAFTAGFTLPGGYNQSDNDPNIGMAILPKWWAFKVFIICNTAALYSSILCVVALIWAQLGDLKLILVSFKFAIPLLGFAMVMMSVSFMTGVFVVLRNASWLSFVVLVVGCVFLLGVLLFFIPLYNPTYIKNSVLRFLYSGTFLLLLLVSEKSTPTIT